ncbi:3-oxoacyl-[acyl-carrier-protein] synthase, KASII [Planctomycetales bacterium 10988]|nr:3-oxoacyl-[acyl-carrier-protein] synthase, KASII [Planctomycetales bacterium 10988]
MGKGSRADEIVITGMGAVSPLGIGTSVVREALFRGDCGLHPIHTFDTTSLPYRYAGEVTDFEPKKYVRPRKSIKVMSRDAQFAVASACFAMEQAQLTVGLEPGQVHPERLGTVVGAAPIRLPLERFGRCYELSMKDGVFNDIEWATHAMSEIYPLSFLNNTPNMLASHVTIALDARGPSNTLYTGDTSSLLAMGEACRVIQRGQADVVLSGAASCRLIPYDWIHAQLTEELADPSLDPQQASRPFDARRTGIGRSEAGAIFVLETRRHAEERGATILASILSHSSSWGTEGAGLKRSIQSTLNKAELTAGDLGHIHADAAGAREGDQIEAEVLRSLEADVPVWAMKGAMGHTYAAAGAMATLGSIIAFQADSVPPTLNYREPDPQCPIPVIHEKPATGLRQTALISSRTSLGQASTLLIAGNQ